MPPIEGTFIFKNLWPDLRPSLSLQKGYQSITYWRYGFFSPGLSDKTLCMLAVLFMRAALLIQALKHRLSIIDVFHYKEKDEDLSKQKVGANQFQLKLTLCTSAI